MDLRHFQGVLRQVLLLPLVALIALGALLSWELRGANQTVESIQKADSCITQSQVIERLLVDQETGLRGFQNTGDERFLEPYKHADEQLPDAFDELARGLDQDRNMRSGEQATLKQLREEYHSWQHEFAEPIITRQDANEDTSDPELNLTGKVRMDSMRALIVHIGALVELDRTERVERWQQQTRYILDSLVVLVILLGVGIGLFTRNRLHSISSAYQVSLDSVQNRALELYQSEERLRTTLQSIGDGVIVCDPQGRVQMMNPTAEELTGWTAGEATGRPLEDVFHIVNESSRELVESPVAKVKRLNRVVGLANHTTLIRKDLSELNIDDSGAPIRKKNGEMIGIVMVFRDITMQKKTEQALLANEKLAVAGRLAATIAHEIHNPLDSVSNLLYLMADGSTAEESRQYLQMAQDELARVTHISRAMLSLYRESRAPVPIDLKELLSEILLLMDVRFHELGVTVTRELPETQRVEGFPAELRQVFTNLITNAAEAAGGGGTITVKLVSEFYGATVMVEDSGPGIPEEIKQRLFQPFFTTKGESGTGLGLWISRGIIQKHGGTISLEGRPEGTGTVARVYLANKPEIHLGGVQPT